VPRLYRVPSRSSPIAQGDIFVGIPCPVFACDHYLVESGGRYALKDLTADPSDGMMVSARVSLVTAIVLTQSCDAPRALNILLAPLSPMDASAGRRWSDIQRLATSLHQPTRVYLPDDPEIALDRQVAELSECFNLTRQELERYALGGKRIASFGDEGVAYLAFRVAMMFWRVARDDYAWPSRADLQLKYAELESSIKKKRAKLATLKHQFGLIPASEGREDELIEIDELERELQQMAATLAATKEAIDRFDQQTGPGGSAI
jgi:hypothetical protein